MAKHKPPKLSRAELAANYGWALATLNSSPDLKKLFSRAVAKQYTPERFIAELRNTKWFKARSEAQRKYIVLKTADPTQYISQVNQVMATLRDQFASATGFTPEGMGPKYVNGKITPGTGWLFKAADEVLAGGLNEAQVRDRVFASVDWMQKISSDSLGGTLSGTLQSLRGQAAAYGVDPSDQWYADRVQSIALGDDSAEGALERIKSLAKQRYTGFADRIDAGETIDDISEGYKQSMAKVLEVNPGEVDVFDNKIQGALTRTNDTGEHMPTSITQFEKELRQDDRWQYTQNAKETLLGQGQNLLRSFGLSA